MDFIQLWGVIGAIANDAETIANFILVFAFLRWSWSFRWVTYRFEEKVLGADKQPTGEVKTFILRMRKRDVNASSMTNAVSSAFYKGGFLPNDVRVQVIEYTNPTFRVG